MSALSINNTSAMQTSAGASALTAQAQATAPSATDTSAAGVNNLSSTFLQLLTQELQNQDPTAPMDSTQMVGQMISLNQLEQLASINQTLSKTPSASPTGASGPAATGKSLSAVAASAQGTAANAALQAASLGNTLGNTSSLLQGASFSGN